MFFPKIIPTNPPISPSKISKETFKLSSVTGTLLSLWVNKALKPKKNILLEWTKHLCLPSLSVQLQKCL